VDSYIFPSFVGFYEFCNFLVMSNKLFSSRLQNKKKLKIKHKPLLPDRFLFHLILKLLELLTVYHIRLKDGGCEKDYSDPPITHWMPNMLLLLYIVSFIWKYRNPIFSKLFNLHESRIKEVFLLFHIYTSFLHFILVVEIKMCPIQYMAYTQSVH
jgi:hypothetical protein